MSSAELSTNDGRQRARDAILGPGLRRATFGGAPRGPGYCPWVRVTIRPVAIRGQRLLQFSYFDAKKHITKNYEPGEAERRLDEVLEFGFAGVHIATDDEELDMRTTKKGKVLVGRRPAMPEASATDEPHNRAKDVPLSEGRADHLLETLGILTRDGHVRPTMRAKYTQINEFLKQLSHVLDDAGLRALGREVQIMDCGCGLSYLTLAVHHYLNDVLAIPARITGVDVNEEVIRKSSERCARLGADVSFACQRIGAADPPTSSPTPSARWHYA